MVGGKGSWGREGEKQPLDRSSPFVLVFTLGDLTRRKNELRHYVNFFIIRLQRGGKGNLGPFHVHFTLFKFPFPRQGKGEFFRTQNKFIKVPATSRATINSLGTITPSRESKTPLSLRDRFISLFPVLLRLIFQGFCAGILIGDDSLHTDISPYGRDMLLL